MNRSWWFRFSVFLGLFIIAAVSLVPTVMNFDPNKSSFPVKSKINLGLDLQGGLYMVLGIDFNKVYADEVRNYMSKIKLTLKDEGIESELGELTKEDITDPMHTLIIKLRHLVRV